MNLLKFNRVKSFYNTYSFWHPLNEADAYIEKNKNNIAYLDIECVGDQNQGCNVILKMWWED